MHEDDFLDDIDSLEELGNDEFEDQTESMDEDQGQQQEKKRLGEDEYNAARDENGKYDKNHYKAENERLNQNLQDAKNERAKGTKEKKGKVKRDQDTGKAMRDPNTGKKLREDPITKNKNIIDKAKDNKRVFDAKNAKFQNKINNAKSKAFKTMHPLEYAKNQLKGKAKTVAKNTAKKAGKATAKGAKKAGKAAVKGAKVAVKGAAKLISLAITNWPITLGIIFFAVLIFVLCIFAGAAGDNISLGNTSGVAASVVKYEVNGITLDNVKVKIVNAAGETIETVNFEKYLMGVTLAQMGRETLSSNPEAFKAALIITRNDILTDDNNYSLSISSDTITTSVDNYKYIYWDYTKPLYKVENEDGTTSYSPDITDTTPGAIVVESAGLNETESASLESISGEVLGKYMKDANDSSKLVDTTLDETKINSIIALGSQNNSYEQILASTYGAANIAIEDGAITYTYTGATGDFINWKQTDPLWGKTIIKDGKTMGGYGCLITSYAIAIAALETETTLSDFNPGTFLNALKKEGAFCGSGAGLNCPNAINKIAPNITINRTFDSLSGKTKEEKIQYVRDNIKENCMMVLQVKTGVDDDTHFTVLDVEGSEAVNWTTLKIYDPATKNGSVFENQSYKNKMSEIRLVCLK